MESKSRSGGRRLAAFFMFSVLMVFLLSAGSVHAMARGWTGGPVVKTHFGLVKGFEDKVDTLAWKAIPYAAPPVEELRWREPADPAPWRGVRQETEFSDSCPQLDDDGVMGSEDCLYLNIWRPDTRERNLPVFVWIHGGGNSLGSAGQPGYDGANFAGRNNAVFVSINYRLGPMGWFAHPALREDGIECEQGDFSCAMQAAAVARNNSGNFGTLDMIKALKWIRWNIKSFGGNFRNVTIAGESAGAHNVLSLILSPLAEGLFHKAIAMSAPNQPGIPMEVADMSTARTLARLLVKDGLAATEEEAYVVIATMGDEKIETYLRSKTAAELIAAYDLISFTMLAVPTILVDGTVIPAEGGRAFEAGTYPGKVPAIIGGTKDEMKLFMAPSFEEIETHFAANYPGRFQPGEGYSVAAHYNSAIWRANGTDSIARAMAAHADQPALFSLQFQWGANPEVVDPQLALLFGCHHGRDVEFYLGNTGSVDASFNIPMNTNANLPGREALIDTTMDYISNFMRTGDPNGEDLPPWPAWSNTPGEPKLITLDAGLTDVITAISNEDLTEEGIFEEMNTLLGPDVAEFILNFSII